MSQDIAQLSSGLHPLERKVLATLKARPMLWDHELMQETSLDESRLSMALGWLLTKGVIKVEEERVTHFVSITELGRKYAEHGIPEKRILNRLKAGEKVTVKDLASLESLDSSEVSTALGNLRSKEHEVVRMGQGGVLEPTGTSLPVLIESVLPSLLRRLQSAAGTVNESDLPVEEKQFLDDVLDKKWKTR
ncbi:MAG: hypothetical protein AABY46_00720, partial [Nitrospirota bacterium]